MAGPNGPGIKMFCLLIKNDLSVHRPTTVPQISDSTGGIGGGDRRGSGVFK